jgi:hypothetical protein
VEIRVIDGQEATDLAGAAEYLKISLRTAREASSPKQQPRTGWPDPLHGGGPGVRKWYALSDLAGLWPRYNPASPPPFRDQDADELVDLAGFAAIRGIKRSTAEYYVHLSRDAWARGEDGYLPRPDPDDCLPAPSGGTIYRWRRRRAVEWSFSPRRSTGRPPASQETTLADYDAVLAEAGPAALQMSILELARALTRYKGVPVSIQTVKRLRRRARERASDTTGS